MSEILTLAEAERLAERLLHDIGLYVMAGEMNGNDRALAIRIDHRERVASDLEGLRDHQLRGAEDMGLWCDRDGDFPCPDACRYSDGLRRTARLYGIEAS